MGKFASADRLKPVILPRTSRGRKLKQWEFAASACG